MNADMDCLAESLRLAATDPANRPEFYRVLLESTVFVIGHASSLAHGAGVLEEGSSVAIEHWERPDGAPVIPFFSSKSALQRAIQGEVSFLAMPARSLFEITRGATLFLNPKSDYGKEFFPSEIESLLKIGLPFGPNRRVVQEDTEVLLGQPKQHPVALVAAVSRLLAKHANVRAAYLALMHDPTVDTKPHLVVGIEADGNAEQVLREAGAVVSELSPGGETVDFVAVERGKGGLSGYLVERTEPFYRRTGE